MLKQVFQLCVISLILFGCTTIPEAPLNLPINSTVGIINLVDTEATHTHFGATIFNSFEKKYPVSWNFPGKIEQELTNQIKSSTEYNVLSIKPTKKISEYESKLIITTWKQKINPELIPEIKEIIQQNKIDILLIIRDDKGMVQDTFWYLNNYGLNTRSLLLLKSSFVYAYSNILGFYGDPPQYIGGARLEEQVWLKDFDYPSNIQELDIDRLNSLAPYVMNKINEFAVKALGQTGLTPIEAEPDSLESIDY